MESTSFFLLKIALLLAGSGLLGYLVGIGIFSWIKKGAQRADLKTADLFLPSLKRHLPLWCLLLAVVIGAQWADLKPAKMALLEQSAIGLFVISLSLAASDLASRVLQAYSGLFSLEVATSSLIRIFIRVIVLGTGLLIILSSLGISITPILTALGVGSLAVALALQDTLSNLFSGFYIIINKQIRVGDYIRLESSQEGFVKDIGWRSCRVEELGGNIIIIPNNRLSQAIVTNYNFPDKLITVPIEVGVSYDSDLDRVEMVVAVVGEEIMKQVPGGVPDFRPVVNFHAFGDSAIQVTAVLKAKEFVDRYAITHEFIKRLHARFKKEGIEMPYPQRVVQIKK